LESPLLFVVDEDDEIFEPLLRSVSPFCTCLATSMGSGSVSERFFFSVFDRSIKKKEEIESKTERAKSKDKGGEMGPPQSRVKVTPNPEDSSRKRKGDRSISPSEDTERKHKRDKSEPSSPPGKKDRKPDRKREREEETSNTEKKKRSLTDPDPIEVAKHVQNGETDRKRGSNISSSSSTTNRRGDSKRK
jgi:hypothetical protein